MVPLAVLLEPFSECFLAGLVFSWSCLYFFSWNMLVVFLYHVLVWFVLDYMLFRQLEVSLRTVSISDVFCSRCCLVLDSLGVCCSCIFDSACRV